LKKLLKDIMVQRGYEEDFAYDWAKRDKVQST